LQIRGYTDADWQYVWPIFREVVAAGETFAYDPAWSSEQARGVWVIAPPGRTVVACDGPRVLGTAHMGPNRPGPGSHVATASFMVAGEMQGRGVGARSASTRSPGLVSRGTPRCSSTPSWNLTPSPCGCGRRLDFASSGPSPKPSSIPRWAASVSMSCTGICDERSA
jgi:hypothetical protein